MISRIAKFLVSDSSHEKEEVLQTSPAKSVSKGPTLPTPATPGFALASPAAIKLLLTLRHLAAAGENRGYCEEMGALTGLTNRTLASALNELRALGWVTAQPLGVFGSPFTLHEPPATLSAQAAKRYAKRIAKLRDRPNPQEQ